MCSASKLLLLATAFCITAGVSGMVKLSAVQPRGTELRVCADPHNLPFSDQDQKGFENELAHFVASQLGRRLRYVWTLQRGNWVRTSLDSGACDLVLGVPAGYGGVATTVPYYRSSYVFISRHDRHLNIASLGDPKLKRLRIGLGVGSDYSSPPAQVLATRGLEANIAGYAGYGNSARATPLAADLVIAAGRGDVDVAIAWGPQAGYFVRDADVPLDLVPIRQEAGAAPFVFSISMAVRRRDGKLRASLDALIRHRSAEIRSILKRYGVPVLQL